MIDNMVEAAAWRKYKNRPTSRGIFLTPCRLLANGCLMMRKIDDLPSFSIPRPKWSSKVEGSQVGLYNHKWVAYDYALDIRERDIWEAQWGVRSEYYHESRSNRDSGTGDSGSLGTEAALDE